MTDSLPKALGGAPVEHLSAALGNEPFPWQRRLLADLLDRRVPRALDLPTGLGKTAVMGIWLVARACGAAHLPRRLVYVVDRRAVVDQATREAERLRLQWAARTDVAAALGLGSRPLPISTLRGQFVDNREWLEDPAAPAIVVGTVDMVGSRLLFEGYACSRKLRPYHAGLLGSDTLIVLDEAHLVPPFERLIEQVTTRAELHPKPELRPLVPPLQLLSLSATGRDHGDKMFRLDDDDLEHPIVRRRTQATKRVTFERLPPSAKLADALAERAWALTEGRVGPVRVIVFCNRRDDADKAQSALLKRARAARGKGADLPEVELFVGARRIRERSLAERRLQTLGFLAGSERPVDHAFLFATSAGEVGVDLDADHLVADVVAWERMVQRLGRVNRRGERGADVVLLAEADSPWVDPVEPLVRALPELEPGWHDGSPSALGALRATKSAELHAACTAEPLHPGLSRALIDAWSMTSLPDHPGRPEIQPWLRGWVDDDEPQTTVLWRRHFPPDPVGPALETFFEAAPPHASEGLEAESFRVAAWVAARASSLRRRVHGADDLVGVVLDGAGSLVDQFTVGQLAALDSSDGRKQLTRRLSGRTLVVRDVVGGLSESGLLDDREDAPPPTGEVGDPGWLPVPLGAAPAVPFRVAERADTEAPEVGWYERLRLPSGASETDEDIERWLVVDKWRHDAATEDDRSAGHPQVLAEHQAWTAAEADRLARALRLPTDLREVLVLAARLHDEGKRAARWQRAFRAPAGDMYAKTRGPLNWRLLDGYRHELGSLPFVERDPAVRVLPGELRDLILHLVAAHHGFARPVIRTAGCDDGAPSAIEDRAREVALRFTRLQERWGPWGLAWLETLVRAADQRASRRNDEQEVG